MMKASSGGDERLRLARFIYVVAAGAALAGCSHTLIRPCITKAQLAELEKQEPEKVSGKLTGKADEDIRPIAGSALKLRAWSYNLRDALRVCAS